MSSYKSGSYVKQNTIKQKSGTITVTRIANVITHESANVITPEEVEQEAWFERLFSEEGSSSTSDWPNTESSSIEEESSLSEETLDERRTIPPVRPTKGKFSRLVSMSKCRLRIKKHCPEVIIEKMLFSRAQKNFSSEFLEWMTWKRYKDLNQARLNYLWTKFIRRLEGVQFEMFIESLYAYEYERLRRKKVLDFLSSLRD